MKRFDWIITICMLGSAYLSGCNEDAKTDVNTAGLIITMVLCAILVTRVLIINPRKDDSDV